MPNLEEVRIVVGSYTSTLNFLSGCSSLRHVTLRKFKFFGFGGAYTQRCYANMMKDCPILESVELGTEAGEITSGLGISGEQQQSFSGCPNLIKIVLGGVGMVNTDVYILKAWSPTLDSSNLQQFLQNFRSFIVLRLANRKTTTALTLTLSANVYNAVTGANSGWASQHTLAELGITDNDLTDLETELGITSATIYATWLDTYTGANGIHWNVNKAN